MANDPLRLTGSALFGPAFRPRLARALGVSGSTVDKWLDGSRTPPPGVRAECVRLLLAHAEHCRAVAGDLARTVGDVHGLTRRETAFIGWAMASDWLVEGPDWPAGWTAARLEARIRSELAGVAMDDGEAQRLIAALTRLTDRQARDVLIAARDIDDLGDLASIPDD